jgi:hypothetical protein
VKIISLVIAALVLASMSGNCADDVAASGDGWIWIEAENPSAGNFPPLDENPYAPGEFWETDTLSGGAWIGMKWTHSEKPSFLEYKFVTPQAGAYYLYARKFFSFGDFRWKVDAGPWHEAGQELHVPLDDVPFRETGERISLDWFYMGRDEIGKGRHTLRIEPVAHPPAAPGAHPVFEPFAYDAFLLTPAPFDPSGKLKPGERYDVQTADSFSIEPGRDPFRESPIDWRRLNEPFAGQGGGLDIRDGRLVFRNSGAPARLLGMNVRLNSFANADSIGSLARFLAKKGFNLVRFDLADAVAGTRGEAGEIVLKPDARKLGILLRAIQACKDNGIFSALTWNVRNSAGHAPGIWVEPPVGPDGIPEEPNNSFSPILSFDPAIQAAYREVWRSVLDAKLPDGSRLGSDPALAFITLNQQDSIFSEGFQPYKMLPPDRMLPIENAFGSWLVARAKGGGLAEILKAWGDGGLPGDEPDAGRAGLPGVPEMASKQDARTRDAARFLAEVQAGFFKSIIGYIKNDLRFGGLVSTSNKLAGQAATLGWINAWSQADGDFTERHGNFLTHFEKNFGIWNAGLGVRYQDRSALRFDPLPGREGSRFDLPVRSLAIGDKPAFITEINWPTPNRFRAEMPLLATTLASIQQVPVLAINNLTSSHWLNAISTDRTPAFTQATMGQMPAFAFAFRNGLLPEGPVVATLGLTEESIFSLRRQALDENADTQIDSALFDTPAQPSDGPHPALWTTGRINVRLGAERDAFEAKPSGPITDRAVGAADGALRWDYKTGLLAVDAPACKAAGGFLKNAGNIALGGVEINSDMEYGVICLVALDGQPVTSSAKILVQVFSEEANSESYADGKPVKTIRSIGRPPILVKNFSGKIRLLRPDADSLVTHALDENGYRTLTAGIGAELKLLPSTMYYLIEK